MPRKQTTNPEPQTDAARAPQAETSDADTLQAYGFNQMANMGLAWTEALSEMGSEVLSFVADRIKEDVKTQHRLMHCRDIDDIQRVQAEFVSTAIAQYQAESGKLVEMSRDLMQLKKDDGPAN